MSATRLPELDALRLLVAVARSGSIGSAARLVGITQQAASERIRSTEAQVGLTLLRRTTRGSALTPAGSVLVEWATRLLDVADEIEHALDGLRGDRDRELVVWSSMSVAESLLPRWLVLLRQRQEGEGLEPTPVTFAAANSTQVAEAVRDGHAHLGFIEGPRTPAGLRSQVVAADALVLVAGAGSPLGRRTRPMSPAEVSRLAMTTREEGSGTREVVAAALRRHQLAPAPAAVELTTATAVREAVAAGGPPAFLSLRVARRDLDSGRLVAVPVADLDLTRTIRAVWSGPTRPPAGPVRDLIGLARTHSD